MEWGRKCGSVIDIDTGTVSVETLSFSSYGVFEADESPATQVEKAALDRREYRALTLPNGLRVFLASDPKVETYKTVQARFWNIYDSQGQILEHIRQSRPGSSLGLSHFLG